MAGRGERRTLVGRQRELERVDLALTGSRHGQPAIILVAGEAGVGKTRFVQEVATHAEAAGARVLEGGSIPLGAEGLPFGPLIEALRELAGELPVSELEELAGTGRGDLERLMPQLLPPGGRSVGPDSADDAAQGRLFEHLLLFLGRLAEQAPLLLVVEDIHWADRSTLRWLGFLIRNLRQQSIALIATYRSDELQRRHPLLPFLAEAERGGRVQRLELGRFDRHDLVVFLEGILGTPAGRDLVSSILARSQGNAFYAEELLTAGPTGHLPDTLREVLLERVATLSEPAEALLRVASAAGPHLSGDLIAEVGGFRPDDLLSGLREAVAQHVLVPREGAGDDRYGFRHALLQEALYGDLLPGERTRLHAAFARVLSGTRPADGEAAWASELAYHWHAAHDLPRAFDAWVAAGIAAEAIYAFEEARLSFERALELWDQIPDAATRAPLDRAELLMRAAFLEQGAAPSRSVAYARAAIALVDPSVDATRAGILYERLGQYTATLLGGGEALAAYQEAVRLVPPRPRSAARARVLAGLGRYLTSTFEFAQAAAVTREALGVAVAVGARDIESQALGTLGTDLIELGDSESGLAMMIQARTVATDLGDVYATARAMAWLAGGLYEAGRLGEAVAAGVEADEYAVRHGLAARWGTIGLYWAADALVTLGRWDEAASALTRALQHNPAGVTELMIEERLLLLEGLQGQFDAARRRAQRVRLLAQRVPEVERPSLGLVGLTAAAELALWTREPLVARTTVGEAVAMIETRPGIDVTRVGWVLALGIRAEADIALRPVAGEAATESTRARDWHPQFVSLARRLLDELTARRPDYAAQAAAWMATCEAEASRAVGSSEPVLWAAAGARWQALDVSYQQAYALMRAGEAALSKHDRRLAADALETARTLAVQLGARPLQGDIDDLVSRSGIRLEPPAAPPALGPAGSAAPAPSSHDVLARRGARTDWTRGRHGLTPRELEVLKLVASGRSDGEIGEALFISRKTASVHVANIKAKLGSDSRVAIVTDAIRFGLIETPG